eukprot:CAMPEP_0117019470 /NCGR_PEP_ID=MMETSP0472-20121206/14938_1 /TAXON_ID=693140 ORGANISM="Tiarina fusus, Strain LIS" /NCGR_SAMPLE_ID=MMETSP0472 /ASSEMBLY_ACC=CAM_ASM_000603 /LENGTH=76 /DNA_ID=CAMNT_0004724447 /DNA_START=8 /DNA_END=238 /DNA_ORIENTATION=+
MADAGADGTEQSIEKAEEQKVIAKYGRLPNKAGVLRRDYQKEHRHFDSGEHFGKVVDPLRGGKPALPQHLRGGGGQ